MVLKYQYPYDLSQYDSSDRYNAPRAGGSNHRGADFNGFPEGTPIPAVAAGTVVENYRSGGLGWLVVLAHSDGAFSGYCHMYQQSPLAIGTAVIEITDSPHTGCAKFSARFGLDALRFVNSPVGKALRLRGANAKVVTPGTVHRGDTIRKR